MTIEILLALECACVWLLSVSLGYRFVRTRHRIGSLEVPQEGISGSANQPLITVVIPARNEVRDVGETIRSLLQQKEVATKIVVVDDHSTDGTGELLDQLALEHQQLTVLHSVELRPGWFGKANAMQHGLEHVGSELVLFTDADIRFEPECLAVALQEFQRCKLDFLSLLPRFDAATFWENVYMPHSFIAGCVRFLPQGVNEQHRPQGAAAGAFMLVRRSVLRDIGDMSVVKQEMLDDISLARAIKRNGYRAEVRFAPKLLSVEMFKTNSHAFWGTTKNILAAVDKLWKAVPLMFLPLLMYWVPLGTAAYGAWVGNWPMASIGTATYLMQAVLLILVLPISRLRWPHALLFPLAAIPVMSSMTVALYHRIVNRGVLWRGRVIAVEQS